MDYLRFTLSDSGRINFRLTAYIPWTKYYIYNENGSEIWYKIEAQWNSVSEEFNLNTDIDLTSGTYYFSVGRSGGSEANGNYRFKLSYTNANESFKETTGGINNSIADASPISLGTTYNGQLAINDSKDIYKFTVSKSGNVNLHLISYIYCINLYIYDANGWEIWSKISREWNHVTEKYELDTDIEFLEGTYYFAVSGNSGTGNYKFTIGGMKNPFTDVSKDAYYYDPVMWAVQNKITTGTSKTTFSPNANCTRAQVVTFLWRAAGSPNPTNNRNPFGDVKSDAYYYKAVLWAVENNITTGTSRTAFSPDAKCTRAQVVTFLYRDIVK